MGFVKKLIKQGVGIAGKQLMNHANLFTGGLAGKAMNAAVSGANNNAGLIGSVANKLGNTFLNSGTRKMLSSAADTAMKFIPKGNVRDALMKINDAAQGRATNPAKLSTTVNPQKTVAAAAPAVAPAAAPSTPNKPRMKDAGYT